MFIGQRASHTPLIKGVITFSWSRLRNGEFSLANQRLINARFGVILFKYVNLIFTKTVYTDIACSSRQTFWSTLDQNGRCEQKHLICGQKMFFFDSHSFLWRHSNQNKKLQMRSIEDDVQTIWSMTYIRSVSEHDQNLGFLFVSAFACVYQVDFTLSFT